THDEELRGGVRGEAFQAARARLLALAGYGILRIRLLINLNARLAIAAQSPPTSIGCSGSGHAATEQIMQKSWLTIGTLLRALFALMLALMAGALLVPIR